MQSSAFLIAVFEFVLLLFSLSVHECAHAWTASLLGDQTARLQGRVRYNDPDTLFELSTETSGITLGGIEGTLTLAMSATETAVLNFKSGVYDLELTAADGITVTRLLQGRVLLSPEVTR